MAQLVINTDGHIVDTESGLIAISAQTETKKYSLVPDGPYPAIQPIALTPAGAETFKITGIVYGHPTAEDGTSWTTAKVMSVDFNNGKTLNANGQWIPTIAIRPWPEPKTLSPQRPRGGPSNFGASLAAALTRHATGRGPKT